MLYARMRTLLNEPFPPHLKNDASFSPPEKMEREHRIFLETPVLTPNEPILTEVGVGETGLAASGAGVDPTHCAPGAGIESSPKYQIAESPVL
jgi:hypothetical protein